MDRAALVPGGLIAAELGLVVPLEKHELASGRGNVPLSCEAADPVMNGGSWRNVAKVNVAIIREMRVEGHADESALPPAVDGDGHKGLAQERPAFDHPEPAGLLAQEDAAVGGHRHCGRAGDPGHDPDARETRRQCDWSDDAAARCSLPGGSKALQEGDQVGEVARTETSGQSIGHQRCVAVRTPHDVQLSDDMPATLDVDERQLIGRLLLDDS